MKKITVFICAAALACSMSFPAFAAQTKKEYNTETAQVRQELADTSASIKNLQKNNRTASDAAKTVRQGWKDSGPRESQFFAPYLPVPSTRVIPKRPMAPAAMSQRIF